MTISFRQMLVATTLVFTVYSLNVLLLEDVYAETVVEAMHKKGQECTNWASPRRSATDQLRTCISQCGRYAISVDSNPELLNNEYIQRCNDSYASAKNQIAGTKKPTIPINKDPDGSRTSTVRTYELPKTTMSSMPDVEGIYLQAMQGRLRVRAEDRNDWNTICVGFARIKDRNDDYARKLKGHDRVRLIGVTYNPNEASGPRGKCSAERIVILGPSQ